MNNKVDFSKVMNSIDNIKLDDYPQEILYEILQKYEEYISVVMNMNEKEQKQFFNTIRCEEMIGTHIFEENDMSLIFEHALSQNKNIDAINYLVNVINKNGRIKMFNFKRVHKILLKGTSINKEDNDKFRDREVFVGYFDNGEKIVQYIPPTVEEIDNWATSILDKINNSINHKGFSHIILEPIVFHALVAILQPFSDGNTRLSRLIQHINTWQLTNSKYNTNLSLPSLYLSSNYYNYKEQYRELLADLALNPDNDNWNRWIMFSLFRIEDQLQIMEDYVNQNYNKKNISTRC